VSTISDARKLARELDVQLETFARTIEGSALALFQRVRGYLLRQDRRLGTKHNLEQIVQYDQGPGDKFQIFLGPPIDKGPSPSFFNFPSGARLSFSIAVREHDDQCDILSYRFHFNFPNGHSPEFVRIDLLDKSHSDPLKEPLAHIHPGIHSIRLPCPPLTPIEVLDRVFFVLDPNTR
jgi:hypothetical protein